MNALHKTPNAFTNAEFDRLVRAGGFGDIRVELRRGMIVKMSPQYVPHAAVKHSLARALETSLAKAGLNWTVYQEVTVDFGGGFAPLPDIVVWDASVMQQGLDGPVPASAVRLVVEVADSSLADDTGDKLEEYAQAGLAEYWVADVRARQITQHAAPNPLTFDRRETRRFGDAFSALTLPALQLDTSALATLRY